MGFEVKYAYYEKGDRGYNTEDEKELTSKVGEPFDDVTLEQLAGAIMAQFARRDIMVFDAEIYELAKKKISFKETNGGIILKNKKYSFDKGAALHCANVVETIAPEPQQSPAQQQQLAQQQLIQPQQQPGISAPPRRPPPPKKKGRVEYFSPPPGNDKEWSKIGLSVGAAYEVLEEVGVKKLEGSPGGEPQWTVQAVRYKIKNDRGETISAPVQNFQATPVPMSSDPLGQGHGNGLMFDSVEGASMPNLR